MFISWKHTHCFPLFVMLLLFNFTLRKGTLRSRSSRIERSDRNARLITRNASEEKRRALRQSNGR